MRAEKAQRIARRVATKVQQELCRAMTDESTGTFEYAGEINLNQGGITNVRTGVMKNMELQNK